VRLALSTAIIGELLVHGAESGGTDARVTKLAFPAFGQVTQYAPPRLPEQVVLFVSGDGGWNLGVVGMAERLRDEGALVVGIDIRAFVKSLEAAKGCAYPAGSLEELSRAVQLQRKLPEYRRPILVGYSSGATLVYATLIAAPSETFAGAISLGFCPDLEMRNAPCAQRGLRFQKKAKGVGYELAPFPGLTVPWMVLQGDVDQVCDPAITRAFVATGAGRLFSLPKVGHGFSVTGRWEPQLVQAYRAIARAQPRASPRASSTAVNDLGLTEVVASKSDGHDAMAVILSGDGGWADIDKELARHLAEAGIPVAGWSSLRYYWTPRTPEGAAADLDRVIAHYSAAWGKDRVLLIGYSFGADVLPFLVNRLPPATRARISSLCLLGPSRTAAFEFHVSTWLGAAADDRYRTVPEIERAGVPLTCIHGSDEKDSACLAVKGPRIRVLSLGTGHHFGGDYSRLADVILGHPEPD
jgi:type IV secretory pathway VirJ component